MKNALRGAGPRTRAARPGSSLPVGIRLLPALLLGAAAAFAGSADPLRIEPGPPEITAEEAALQADPAAGIEHAVILVEETRRDEDRGLATETTYHLRAKILSAEGRDLANVELPWLERSGRLKKWWGRTILPDGTVRELRRSDLERSRRRAS